MLLVIDIFTLIFKITMLNVNLVPIYCNALVRFAMLLAPVR